MVAKGFIAQVGIKGYDAHVAAIDLLATQMNDVIVPLSVNVHNFLVIYKEAAKLTFVPTPTVTHSMSGVINQVNGATAPAEAREQDETSTDISNQAAAILLTKIAAAKAAVAQATTHKDLAHAIAEQATGIAKEAFQQRVRAKKFLDEALCMQAALINQVEIAAAVEILEEAEITYNEKEQSATAKGNIAYGANAFAKRAYDKFYVATRALNALRQQQAAPTNEQASPTGNGSPKETKSPTSPQVAATAAVTPGTNGTILPNNPYVWVSSLLHKETATAIREMNNLPQDKAMSDAGDDAAIVGGRTVVLAAMKKLMEQGVVGPLLQFHACITRNQQERRIAKATIEPCLTSAAKKIVAVVEAEHPASRPTLKGLIHNDVDKTTDELKQRIQSLEAKLGNKQAKNVKGNGKKKKGKAVAQKNTKPKTATSSPPSTKKKQSKWNEQSKKKVERNPPAAKSKGTNADASKSKTPPSKNKSRGKNQGKCITARK
jgi:hypothetical protein